MMLKKFLLLAACALVSTCVSACSDEQRLSAAESAAQQQQQQSPEKKQQDARALPAAAPSSFDAEVFRGDIGGKYKVQMRLRREGGNLSGAYFYEHKRTDITLRGTIDAGGNFTLQEFDAEGRTTGVFRGVWKDAGDEDGSPRAILEGKWSKPDGANALPFFLDEFPVALSGGLSLVSESIEEENKRQKYTIEAEYPQLRQASAARASDGAANVAEFDRTVKTLVTEKIREFKRDVSEWETNAVAGSHTGSSLDIGYTVGVANDRIVSVEFQIGTYFRGAAHPNTSTEVVNYDLQSGRVLKLADLFKPSAKYLETIAAYAIADLKKQSRRHAPEPMLTDESIQSGASASAENYRSWLITKRGISVTFDAYRVGPYAAGPQFVSIPYAALREIIRPDGALAGFVK